MNNYHVTRAFDGMRLDAFCTEHSPLSRSKITEMIQSHLILLNDKPTKPKSKVKLGDIITIHDYIPKETRIKSVSMDLDIIYEDHHLLVVNKPRGLMVHPAKGVPTLTLLNGLVYHFNQQGLYHTPGIVHRIDKDTEGLLVIAKDSITHNALASQLLDKTLNRHYIAVCHNQASFDETDVNEPIGVNPIDPTKMAIHGLQSKHALTHFKLIENHPTYCVLECILETGRTHQIRVHASFINHPLVGDKVYGPDKQASGQALCAYKIAFIHPISKKPLEFSISYHETIHYACEILSSH